MPLEIVKKDFGENDDEINVINEIKYWIFIILTFTISLFLFFYAGHLLMNF